MKRLDLAKQRNKDENSVKTEVTYNNTQSQDNCRKFSRWAYQPLGKYTKAIFFKQKVKWETADLFVKSQAFEIGV